jgi:DNA topoisomerase-3
LRPTPIIAVTATATEMVQDDIVTQLGLEKAKRFIHGFRRTNIAIEVVEIGVSERDALATSILKGKDRLPAIVYSPTRKHCESFAAHLKTELKAEAYHAGLPPLERDRIQSAFIKGELDAVVATIAFGMGIDKSNVRTVIHMALPSSLEAYYQEIGRAGRDGKPSRAILLHSYSDRRTHEYFHEQDYPEASILKKIFDSTKDTASPLGSIQQQVKIDADVFAKAIEKLWTHGGVTIDYQENVVRGTADWQKKYLIQREHKLAQLNLMEAFVKTRSCRMVHVIQHFGDKTDKELQCQMCDQCDSSHCLAQKCRVPTEIEDDALLKMYEALSERNGLSLGKLYTAHQQTSALARDTFESLVDGLAREGWVELRTDSFVKDNKTIRFQRVFLTQRARTASSFNLEGSVVPMRAISSSSTKTKKQKREKKETELKKSLGPLDGAALETFQQLRDWRTAEAKKRKVPPFMILTDRVLRAIAVNRPKDENELLEISGFGPKLYEKHGASMLQIIGGSGLD